MRAARIFLLLLLIFAGAASSSQAQLAQSFYNITGIKTDVLPNAIRITIETDGNVDLGVDLREFVDPSGSLDSFRIVPVRKFRIRFVGARAKIPAFVEIGKYPVDAVNVSLARDIFQIPIFDRRDNYNPGDATTPAMDVELRFFVPIRLTGLSLNSGDDSQFGLRMQPLDCRIAVDRNHRNVIITILSDRAEINRSAKAMRRSPPEGHKHRLTVTKSETGVTVDALHTPLAEVLSQVANVTGVPIATQPDAADADITLFLPDRDLPSLLTSLSTGYGLVAVPNPVSEVGGYLVGRNGTATVAERLPVHYQPAENLRLLFPDFLFPALRVDTENNALIVNGSPALVNRVKEDVQRLDRPTATVRVEATAYEIRDGDDFTFALSALFSEGKWGFDTNAGTITSLLTDDQREQYQFRLNALVARGRARLNARPSVVVQSGKPGTLFFGQTRFLQVLVDNFGQQTASVINIPVGTTIAVTPTASPSKDGHILLELAPRFSTVDATETGTGLPTLGIREVTTTIRVREGDTILVAGLLSENESAARQGIFGIGTRRKEASRVALAVLITAKRLN